MSRIRVAAFKHNQMRLKLKKNPKCLASLEYKKNVINCTIQQPDSSSIVKLPCKWDLSKTIEGTKETAVWNANKWYKDIRSSSKKKGAWYMLDTRKRIDAKTNKKLPSEAAEMYNRTIPKRMTREERWEALAQAKLAKWEKKNPCPIKDNVNEPDLFEAQYLPQWQAERDAALERFRDFVVSVYDKLHIVGNRVVKEPHGHMKESKVAEVKDVDGKGHDVRYPNLKPTDKLYKNATKAATIAMNKDSTIVDCSLKNHKKTQTRPLIDAKRSYKQAA